MKLPLALLASFLLLQSGYGADKKLYAKSFIGQKVIEEILKK